MQKTIEQITELLSTLEQQEEYSLFVFRLKNKVKASVLTFEIDKILKAVLPLCDDWTEENKTLIRAHMEKVESLNEEIKRLEKL